jgi:hypothetical protein
LTIHISVDPKTGHFTYVPSVLRARHGDPVNWKCESGNFVLMFRDSTPLERFTLHGVIHRETEPMTVEPHAKRGHHHYQVAIAVETEEGIRVYIDGGCPDIIVD